MSQSPQASAPEGDAYEWFVRGRALYEAGSAGAAAQLLTRALEVEPEARSIREMLARALFDAGRYADSAREFESLVELGPDDHYAQFGAGLANWRLSRLTAAAEHLAIAAAMRPGLRHYRDARDQVRATIRARGLAGRTSDGPLSWAEAVAGSAQGTDAHPAGPSPLPTISPAAADEEGATTGLTLSRSHDVVLLDLDGVVYRGAQAVPHAVQCIRAAVGQGVHAAYVTNNASRTASEVAEHLNELGLQVRVEDVVTSAQAGAALICAVVPAGARVLAVGGDGVPVALAAEGLTPVRPRELAGGAPAVVAVLMGYGPDVGWADLAEVSYAVADGAAFYASNTDLTLPTGRGIAPGNGTLVAAVVTATGVTPTVAGKPYSPLLRQSIERTGARSPLVVGDRLDTDIEAANRLGLPSLLVLTGVTDVPVLLAAEPQHRPRYVAADLRGLLGRGRLVRPGAAAWLDERSALQVRLDQQWEDSADPLGRLRAAAAVCWAGRDQGRSVTWSDEVLAALSTDVDHALTGGSGP